MIGLRNTYRTTLYIENENFFDYLEKYGLPVCMKDEQYFPQDAIRENIENILSKPISEAFFIKNTIHVVARDHKLWFVVLCIS